MSSVKENLISLKGTFMTYRANSIHALVMHQMNGNPHALDTLVALREALPEGFADFKDFESARSWSRKSALQVFDRAIEAQP